MIVFEMLFVLVYGFVYDDCWLCLFEMIVIVLLIVGVGWLVCLYVNDKFV